MTNRLSKRVYGMDDIGISINAVRAALDPKGIQISPQRRKTCTTN